VDITVDEATWLLNRGAAEQVAEAPPEPVPLELDPEPTPTDPGPTVHELDEEPLPEEDLGQDLAELSKAELVDIAEELGLPASGTKHELRIRIKEATHR